MLWPVRSVTAQVISLLLSLASSRTFFFVTPFRSGSSLSSAVSSLVPARLILIKSCHLILIESWSLEPSFSAQFGICIWPSFTFSARRQPSS